jgi:2-polyprenyl-3-methyl-5-hydroxy-6-metoxy-1,4-benzoquinol methylase
MNEYRGYQEWKSWEKSKFGLYSKDQGLYYRKELTLCGVNVAAELRVLEIGFGNGSFSGWAKDQGFAYLGLETIEALVTDAQSRGFSAALSSNNLDSFVPAESQDLIVAFDVFEHLSLRELDVYLKKARGWLRPQGLLVFRVPSGDSPFSRALQYGDLTHQITLGSSSIQQLALSAHYQVDQVRAPVMPLRGLSVYRATRRLFVLFGQAIISKFVRVLFHHNARTVITANMLVALRKPPVGH